MDITIDTRFVRSEKPLSNDFKQLLEKKIQIFNELDLSKYELDKNELKTLEEEIKEVSGYISH